MDKPTLKPTRANFCSGPCEKRPGYTLSALRTDVLGRSHRSALGKARLKQSIADTRRILGIPADYRIGIVPGSDTGAFELALWNLLGPRPVDVFSWESFGEGWATDILEQLSLPNVRHVQAAYGELPAFASWDPAHDLVFTWNGTTSGVKVPDGDFIPDDRAGLTLCDATSAVFAMDLPWSKLDVVTFSWQKVLGGEAAHGMLVLSPRAVARLGSYDPAWPLPKIFRIKQGRVLNEDLFDGSPINTPSMLANEDYLDALSWVDAIGGLPALIERSQQNLSVLERFVAHTPWIHFLARDPKVRSNTSVCLTLDISPPQVKKLVALLESEGVAYDIGSYKEAPPGLRFWCGATVERENLERVLPWLSWAYEQVRAG